MRRLCASWLKVRYTLLEDIYGFIPISSISLNRFGLNLVSEISIVVLSICGFRDRSYTEGCILQGRKLIYILFSVFPSLFTCISVEKVFTNRYFMVKRFMKMGAVSHVLPVEGNYCISVLSIPFDLGEIWYSRLTQNAVEHFCIS